jgi:hypothetical protein
VPRGTNLLWLLATLAALFGADCIAGGLGSPPSLWVAPVLLVPYLPALAVQLAHSRGLPRRPGRHGRCA